MWAHTGSNRGPSACKADALNQLSYAPERDCKYRRKMIPKYTWTIIYEGHWIFGVFLDNFVFYRV